MIPKEILKKVKRIQIQTSHLVDEVFCGEYESVFKGRGMEFDEVREYQPGDEVNTIDWNVTARMGRPFVKKYIEERELTVMFLIDLSGSQNFGSVHKTKGEIAAEICAAISFSAVKSNDKIGLIIFTDRVEAYVPPKKGKRHVLRAVREVLWHKPEHTGTDISAALDFMGKVTKRKCVAFLISDFISPDASKAMRVTARRHDLIAVNISDKREKVLPNIGLIEMTDAETGAQLTLDSSSAKVRAAFQAAATERQETVKRNLNSIGIDLIELETDQPYMDAFRKFFHKRTTRAGRHR